jgi:1,4-dihydroxy-2-naphthoate octaprenyltransferase
LKYNALGDFDIVMAFAFLPTLGTSYVATGAIDWNVLFVALPVGLITDGILHSNNSRDVVTDRRAGIVTMAMSMGAEKSVWLFGFEMLFPYVWVAALSIAGLLPVYTVFIFLTLPVAIGNARTMAKSLKAGVEMIADLDVKTANLQLMFSVLLTAALVAAKFI